MFLYLLFIPFPLFISVIDIFTSLLLYMVFLVLCALHNFIYYFLDCLCVLTNYDCTFAGAIQQYYLYQRNLHFFSSVIHFSLFCKRISQFVQIKKPSKIFPTIRPGHFKRLLFILLYDQIHISAWQYKEGLIQLYFLDHIPSLLSVCSDGTVMYFCVYTDLPQFL